LRGANEIKELAKQTAEATEDIKRASRVQNSAGLAITISRDYAVIKKCGICRACGH